MPRPWLKIAAQFILKDMPKDVPGIRSTHYSFPGPNGPVPMHKLALRLIVTVIEWYSLFTPVDELNAELAKLRGVLATAQIEPRDED